MCSEDTVPPLMPELWRSILPHLSVNDSCSLALVNRIMLGRARRHKKWTHLNINWNTVKRRGAASLFNCTSFNQVKELILEEDLYSYDSSTDSDDEAELIDDILECCINCSTLEEMVFKVDISQASPTLLAGAVSGLKGVSFGYMSNLTNVQLIKILEESPDLVKLEVPHMKMLNSITTRIPRLLGNLATQLIKLDVSSSNFTPTQMELLLEKCLQSTTLKELDLSGNDLSEVSPTLLGNVCANLQTVNLQATKLTTQQITPILKSCLTSSTLKSIDLSINNWATKVSLQLLCTVVPKLETFIMNKCLKEPEERQFLYDSPITDILLHSLSSTTLNKLSFGSYCYLINMKKIKSSPRLYQLDLSDQGLLMHPASIQAILAKAVETSSLFSIDLSGINLSSQPPLLLANLASQLYTINLAHTRLTTSTITSIFTSLLQSTSIKQINLSDNTLTHVPADLIASVAEKLEKITAEAAGLTTEQAEKMMQTSALCCFSFNDLSEVDPEVVYRNCRKSSLAVNKATCLTTWQIERLLEMYGQCKDELGKFAISYQNLSEVPVDLLSKFVSDFSQVSLDNCHLTNDQVKGILEKSLESTSQLKSLWLYGHEFHDNMPVRLRERLRQLDGSDAM